MISMNIFLSTIFIVLKRVRHWIIDYNGPGALLLKNMCGHIRNRYIKNDNLHHSNSKLQMLRYHFYVTVIFVFILFQNIHNMYIVLLY